jgi:hypothetical protein
MSIRVRVASLLTAALAAVFVVSAAALAQDAAPAAASQTARPAGLARPYAIEFRARSAHNYGHTFSIHGRVNAQGKFIKPTVSGLHPATESPVPWMVGHLVAVPSETGPSDGDLEEQYVLARFRIALSESEYKRVLAHIKKLNDKSPVWHAVAYNCNTYIADIASFMGYKTPGSTLAMPQEYIDGLRDANIDRKDLAGVIGTPVQVASAESLRASALKGAGRSKPAAPKPAAAAATYDPMPTAAPPAAASKPAAQAPKPAATSAPAAQSPKPAATSAAQAPKPTTVATRPAPKPQVEERVDFRAN